MNNIEKDDKNIYENLANLIPKVKMIENLSYKKNLTFKIREVMDKIKQLKNEYENINPGMESIFFQKKENVEKTIVLLIEEIETSLGLYDEDKPKIKK